MKKRINIMVALIMVLSLVACANTINTEKSVNTSKGLILEIPQLPENTSYFELNILPDHGGYAYPLIKIVYNNYDTNKIKEIICPFADSGKNYVYEIMCISKDGEYLGAPVQGVDVKAESGIGEPKFINTPAANYEPETDTMTFTEFPKFNNEIEDFIKSNDAGTSRWTSYYITKDDENPTEVWSTIFRVDDQYKVFDNDTELKNKLKGKTLKFQRFRFEAYLNDIRYIFYLPEDSYNMPEITITK